MEYGQVVVGRKTSGTIACDNFYIIYCVVESCVMLRLACTKSSPRGGCKTCSTDLWLGV